MEMSSKVNWLVNEYSPGSVVLQQSLGQHGISHSLTQKYVLNGWLKRLASGVFYRPQNDVKTPPSWPALLSALISQTDSNVHLAGLSSLQHQGMSHYLALNPTNTVNQAKERVWIGTDNKQSLPKWFKELSNIDWVYCKNKLADQTSQSKVSISIKSSEVIASSPELAAYEIVSVVGKDISFEHVAELFQGLVSLSPKKVQAILANSKSVQTNRVFLFLSHYYDHQWAKRLDESAINLGAGKRQVVADGYYDHQYKITVPTGFKPEY
jgi:hypothetical protein